jgi:hypothetical protein
MSGARADDPAPPGVLWQTTSQMSMEGMPVQMPAQTLKVCAAAEWTGPPAAGEHERGCVTSDFQRDGNTVSWTSVCEGPPAMTGEAEITFADESAKAYTGEIRYVSEEGNLVIALRGSVIGTCDNPR